ncbi:MAG: hypothetical protein A3D67_02170 [Candidatus Lloydbacteria bacterium RIFCSPHIGHO2_02_FULL_51_22]|uniref:DNA 3'-5' helicase n=2 Tax=Candidatus Lloydiibacteriota TaxID=1817910 RepID=A0A1G2DFT1_9BACT|nr:MAG: hypothetical protein A3D67_02170 [Candidatus Lloydbacteria bacterium RIFCSPHIGHO2_02_FULL_51_22]
MTPIMISSSFLSSYKKLNPAQKKAVDSIEGPVMVIAGPGTGKTQILTLRIANILRLTDTAPENILALTFTESGVFSMRRRLVEIAGEVGYRVRIHTFHGFANGLIQGYPDEFPEIIGATHIHEVEKIDLVKEIIQKHKGEHLRPFGDPFFYVTKILGAVSDLKREYVTPARMKKLARERIREWKRTPDLSHEHGAHKGKIKGKYALAAKLLERDLELADVYEKYEAALLSRRRYDYDDMVLHAVRALEKNADLLLSLQEEHQYILADEHQDANQSQNRMLELLASYHENPNLFIVGDEKQAIYRFQGASLQNFSNFMRLYPKAVKIALKENYRSTQPILDAAHAVIAKGGEQASIRVRLLSQEKKTASPPLSAVFSRPEFQYAYIAQDIKKKIAAGVPAEEIAVLYRDNKDAHSVGPVFLKSGVPFAIESEQNVLHDPLIRKLFLLVRAVCHYGDDGRLLGVLHLDFLKQKNSDVYKVLRYAGGKRLSLYETIESKTHLRAAGVEDSARLLLLATQLDRWKTSGENTSPLSFFETLVDESGFLASLLSGSEPMDRLDALTTVFDWVKTIISPDRKNGRASLLKEVVAYFDTLEEHNLSLVSHPATAGRPGKVRLMTAHKAKGLEFDFVYLIDAHDGKWGNKREVRYFTPASAYTLRMKDASPTAFSGSMEVDKNDDERRLFYVALTRARKEVFASYAKESADGKERLPAQFVGEIDETYRRELPTKDFEERLAPQFFFMPPSGTPSSLKDKAFLNTLFLEQGLSVTALNNYLTCPWNYFYNNLLRIPRVAGKHASFGTAVHAALKVYGDARRKGVRFGKKVFIDAFLSALKKEPLSLEDFTDCVNKGKEVLGGYFDAHKDEETGDARAEMKLEAPFSLGGFSVPLRGLLDKVEFLHTGEARVTDYKTGRPKSRNEIEGKTQTGDGGYKRQLVFYKLLLSLQTREKPYTMTEGVIAFIEPDQGGRYREEVFCISDDEVEVLKEEIRRVSKEIYTLAFWNARCTPRASFKTREKCRYCALRDMLR